MIPPYSNKLRVPNFRIMRMQMIVQMRDGQLQTKLFPLEVMMKGIKANFEPGKFKSFHKRCVIEQVFSKVACIVAGKKEIF
jgi:hypothetical protein